MFVALSIFPFDFVALSGFPAERILLQKAWLFTYLFFTYLGPFVFWPEVRLKKALSKPGTNWLLAVFVTQLLFVVVPLNWSININEIPAFLTPKKPA